MKKKALIFIFLFVYTNALLATVTVDGNAYLENQSSHEGIKVLFERVAPSSIIDSTYTNSDGHFTIDIETGIYNIVYSKEGYDEGLLIEAIYTNNTLPDITLTEHITLLNVPSVFATIQSAINYAWESDTVLVFPGNYLENINFNGKNITVASLIYITQDTSYISSTIIDGDYSGGVVIFESGEDTTAVFNGFTIKNGNNVYGGGIACYNSSPSLHNLNITSNLAESGGGIYCGYYSSPSLKNVTITYNCAYYSGRGGGIYCYRYSSPTLENVTIADNSANYYGGGIYCFDNSSPILINSVVSDNICNYGIYVNNSCNPIITYSDFWNNEGGNFYGCGEWIGVNVTTNANGDSCDAYYNIQLDPLFVNTLNGDYHLSWVNYPIPDSTKSPCIDAGDPSSPLDPDGTVADMGAYYYHQTVSIDEPVQSTEFNLTNYPNPISSNINNLTISFSIHKSSNVKIQLFNIKGQLVSTLINEDKNIGDYTITHPVNELSSGIYFTRMSVDGVDKEIRKMILLR